VDKPQKNVVGQQVLTFCQIQLALNDDREQRLRKDLVDCKIQKEFLTQTIAALTKRDANDG
jgi:hypothetical protein